MRDARPDDLEAVQKIAAANGLGDNYQWPWGGAWGAVAILDDQVVAFLAGRDIPQGIVVEDFWAQKDADGMRGFAALSKWIEETGTELARKLGHTVNVGGVVFPHNERHRNTLIKNGYSHYADVYAKAYNP